MSTLSIPLPNDMIKAIDQLIKNGVASNKADLVHRALKDYIRGQAIQVALKADKEPTLHGDIDELMKKLKD